MELRESKRLCHRYQRYGLSAKKFVVWTSAESCAVACWKLHRSNDRRFVAAAFGGYSHFRVRRGKVLFSVAVTNVGKTEQVIGREGEIATFIWRCLVNSELRVGGFAPRQLRR